MYSKMNTDIYRLIIESDIANFTNTVLVSKLWRKLANKALNKHILNNVEYNEYFNFRMLSIKIFGRFRILFYTSTSAQMQGKSHYQIPTFELYTAHNTFVYGRFMVEYLYTIVRDVLPNGKLTSEPNARVTKIVNILIPLYIHGRLY
jgi:hypothetical protein